MHSITTCIFCGQTRLVSSDNFNSIDQSQKEKVDTARSSIGIGSSSSSTEPEPSATSSLGNIYPVHVGHVGMPENISRLMNLLINRIQLTNNSEFTIDDLLVLERVNKYIRKIFNGTWKVLLSQNVYLNKEKIKNFGSSDALYSDMISSSFDPLIAPWLLSRLQNKRACLQNRKINMPLCVVNNDQRVLEAINKNYPELLELLLASGANVEAQNTDGLTILMRAAELGHTECMKVIMRAGADLEKTIWKNLNTITAFSLVKNRQEAGLLLIWEMEFRGTIETCDALNWLLDIPLDLEINEKATPLMYAAGSGNEQFVSTLINAKANVNAIEPEGGQTALMWAAYKGHAQVVWDLLCSGANKNIINHFGSTALAMAKEAKSSTENLLDFFTKCNDVDNIKKSSEKLINYNKIIWMLSSDFFRKKIEFENSPMDSTVNTK